MKVIISHSQKQHSYRFATALKQIAMLSSFYTSLILVRNSKLDRLASILKFSRFLKKRTCNTLMPSDVQMTWFPELMYQIIKKYDSHYAAYVLDRLHDRIVAFFLAKNDCDVIVGYERQSLKTFKKAKRLRITTVLDLASIHPMAQKKLNDGYNNITTGHVVKKVVEKNRLVKLEEYNYVDKVIVLSEYAKKTCMDYGVNESKITVMHLGVDTDYFNIKPTYENEKFKILFVAGVRYWKGIKDLIEVIQEINKDDLFLEIIGSSGDAMEYVKSNLSTNISYVAHLPQEELRDYYQMASVFVLPSYMDSWGQVVCEAMACGTPVIVSNSTGASDIVQNGKNGFIIDTGSKSELKEKILYMYNHRELLEPMGKSARTSVAGLTWNNYYKQIDGFFRSLS